MNYLITVLKDPYRVPYFILKRIAFLFRNDETYLKWYYFLNMHKFPDLEHPKTFNEKLTWLKLHDKHPEYSRLVDKYEVKKYVAEKIGQQYIIPTLGIWDDVEDIDFDKLPNQFVLKITSDSGGIIICRDKAKLNYNKVRKLMRKSQKRHFFAENREYPYRNVKPRIIAEQYMEVESCKSLNDYKFFCFDGEPKLLLVITDREKKACYDFFDMNFNHLSIRRTHPWAQPQVVCPKEFETMKEIASTLAQGFPHVRIDLYNVDGCIYFGEFTFFSASGNMPFEPEEWDYKLGEWLNLPLSIDKNGK